MTGIIDRLRILQTIGIVILVGVWPVLSQAADDAPDPVLTTLQAQLDLALVDIRPRVKFEIPAGYGGRSLIVRYQTRRYMIYPRNKAGRLGRELVDEEGPGDEGFLLRVHVQAKGEQNQAVVPQTLQTPYWKTYLNVYPIEDSDHQIYIALSYRGLTDKRLIRRIQRVIGQGGAEHPDNDLEPNSKNDEKSNPRSERRSQSRGVGL